MTHPEILTAEAVSDGLTQLDGWDLDGPMIRKEFELPSFPAAISFVVHMAFLAEAADHHPDIDIRWRKVTVALTTHEADGLTNRDFDLAGKIDALLT